MKYQNQNILFFVAILLYLFYSNTLLAQVGLSPKLFEYSDSTKAKNTLKWHNLQEWNNFNQFELSLKYYNKNYNFDRNRYHPSNVMPKDPLKLDYRSGSYYVPRMVKDELNLMMNRPKDNSFVPILGVAFIAAQLASKYIFLQDKIKITNENILNSMDNYEILNELWKTNPQSASQLYLIPILNDKYTMNELITNIEILIDNKLVKQKNIEDDEMLYFAALSKNEFDQFLQIIIVDSSITKKDKERLRKVVGN